MMGFLGKLSHYGDKKRLVSFLKAILGENTQKAIF
jgi:hypothetical protein